MKKVAIVRRNGLGDLICTLPLIYYLIDRGDDITLFIDERNAPLIPYLPPLGKIVVLPITGNKYITHLKVALAHRKARYDLALSAKTSPMKLINIFLYVLGAKKRIAYTDESWHRLLINAPIPFDLKKSKRTHQALKALEMVAPHLSFIPKEHYPRLIPPKTKSPLLPPQPILLLSASTTRPSSRFDERRYAALVNRLYNEKGNFFTLILGEPKDQIRGAVLASHLKVPHLLHFPTNFDEFVHLVSSSDFIFIGDGGIGHIAAALDKQLVILFGESHPAEWAPLGNQVTTLYDRVHVNRLKDDEIYAQIKLFTNHKRNDV